MHVCLSFLLNLTFFLMILGAETFRQEDSASRRRKAEQTKRSRQRQKEKRLLELERKRERNKRERNKTIISYRDQQVVNMEEEEEEEEREEREVPSTPAFKVGEVVSIKGDTTERGYASLFIYFLRHASYFRR